MKIDTDEVLVPNWWSREELSDLVGKRISKKQFAKFKYEFGTYLAELTSGMVHDKFHEFLREERESK